LLHTEIVLEMPPLAEAPIAAGEAPPAPAVTRRVLQRLVHVPAVPSKTQADSKKTVSKLVSPGPAAGTMGKGGVPGLVLRPPLRANARPPLIAPGVRGLPAAQPLDFPFTGEYELFRASSGRLPAGSAIDTGTPLDMVYGTTNGGPMLTVAVQAFETPFNMTNCEKVLVELISRDTMPLLATLRLVAERSVEDAGTELMGMQPGREETLEFQIPHSAKPLLIHAMRITFQRPGFDQEKSARIAIHRFTLQERNR
jgi:hypothetical protein